MRVLITDDSTFMRTALARALTGAGVEVVGRAKDGAEAVTLAKSLRPDVITMDIEMPEMDGLTALRRIMRESPTRVLMCSSLTTAGSVQSLQALRLGAADVIAKDNGSMYPGSSGFMDDFVRRVKALAQNPVVSDAGAGAATASDNPRAGVAELSLRADAFDLIVIGSSTGGPPILEKLVAALPADLAQPVVIAQHMPRLFTESMAQRLGELARIPVRHGQTGDEVRAGEVIIAPGGEHCHITGRSKNLHIRTGREPETDLYKPSVDVLFRTAASAMGGRVLAVILTGIGEDGAKGAAELHRAGATIIAQDRASCVVYGMPRAVTERGYATASLNPASIASHLRTLSPVAKAA